MCANCRHAHFFRIRESGGNLVPTLTSAKRLEEIIARQHLMCKVGQKSLRKQWRDGRKIWLNAVLSAHQSVLVPGNRALWRWRNPQNYRLSLSHAHKVHRVETAATEFTDGEQRIAIESTETHGAYLVEREGLLKRARVARNRTKFSHTPTFLRAYRHKMK
jgi:hypothetical protein